MTTPVLPDPAPIEPEVPRGARRAVLLRLALTVVVLGIVVGVVWFLVAPTPEFVRRPEGAGYVKDLPSEYVAMDGWFAALGAVAGVVVAVVALRSRVLDASIVVAVAVLGLLGSFLAWGVGRFLGPDEPSLENIPAVGDVVNGELTLNAKGVLLIWPVVSLVILTFALAWTTRDDRRPVAAPATRADGAPGTP